MQIDRHIPRDSPVHRFDARLKLVLAVGAIVGIALLPSGSFAAFAIVWLVTVAGSSLARLGPWRVTRSSWMALPFVLVALPLIFTRPGEVLVTFDIGPLSLSITQEGVRDALSIVTRSWLSVQVALLLAYTTPFPTLLDALRSLRLPAIMVSIISFMYRYLAVIGEEAGRMNRARDARSASVAGRGGSLIWRARVAGSIVGTLFIRSYERSERVYSAMLARGFDGTLHGAVQARPANVELATFGVALVAMALFVAVVILWRPRW
jgi:cobalt/nickel transport system permease protein